MKMSKRRLAALHAEIAARGGITEEQVIRTTESLLRGLEQAGEGNVYLKKGE